jgi:hypothetical protein
MPRTLPKSDSKSTAEMDGELALATIAIFSALSDGTLTSRDESFVLDEVLLAVDLFEDYEEEDFEEIEAEANALLQEDGIDAAVNQAIAVLNEEELQEDAYVTALITVAIEGEIPATEFDYLEGLRQALNLSKERTQEIMDELTGDFEDDDFEADEE